MSPAPADGEIADRVQVGLACRALALALPYAPAIVARLRGRERPPAGRLAFADNDQSA